MGTGFDTLFDFVLLPLAAASLAVWFFVYSKPYGKYVLYAAIGFIVAVGGLKGYDLYLKSTHIKAEDLYGSYIIDRSEYPGENADWQYNEFRFDIVPPNDIRFHKTTMERIANTTDGKLFFKERYRDFDELTLQMERSRHLWDIQPIVRGDNEQFHLVFRSTEFGDMFFIKGEWKPLED